MKETSTNVRYYAKPESGAQGSYEYHIDRCHAVWQRIFISSWSQELQQTVEALGLPWEQFRERMCYAVLMHDAGKLLPIFQRRMQQLLKLNGENETDGNEAKDSPQHFRHELWSAICMFPRIRERYGLQFPYDWFAVIGHHKLLDKNLTSFTREKEQWREWPVLDDEALQFIYQYTSDKMRVSQCEDVGNVVEYAPILKRFQSPDCRKNFLAIWDGYVKLIPSHNQQARLQYALAKGMLHTCDWLASSSADVVLQSATTADDLWNLMRAKVEGEGKVYQERPFHLACAEAQGNIIVIAPTGSGKTEAALLWALQSGCGKVMFLMPTMVTSNNLYERLFNYYFQQKECGLSHSSMDNYFARSLGQEGEFADQEHVVELRKTLLLNKAFMKPVMVSTVDQLLTTQFNTGAWTQKLFALVGNRVVFDEIHAYDTYTLALITEMIRTIQQLGGNVLLMSATMPSGLRNHFKQEVGIQQIVVAEELMDRKRATWRYIEQPIEECSNDIKQKLNQGKRVAIIVNTVGRAKALYLEWASILGDEVLCYHSEFTMTDRLAKEQRLTNDKEVAVKLLIATQAVEVSLDISFDVMYSECAPLDALVQRAGRCNRYGLVSDAEMIVFPVSEAAYKYVYRDKRYLIDRTKDIIEQHVGKWSERDVANFMEIVYEDMIWKDDDYAEGLRAARSGIASGIFDNQIDTEKTRLFKYAKTSIIPACYYEEVIRLCKEKQYALVSNYEVPVSMAVYKNHLQYMTLDNPYKLPLCEVEYSSDIGLVIKKDDFDHYSF